MHVPRSKPVASPPHLLAGLSAIAGNYDAILCDVWGVIHNGVAPYPDAVDALQRFRAQGKTVVLITNAPRPGSIVVEFLDALRVPRDAYDGLVSSGDVAVYLILERGNRPLAHIGPAQDRSLFVAAEALSGRAMPLVDLAAADFVVCTGFIDAEKEVPGDYAGRLDLMARRDLDFLCANPDIVVEVGNKLLYCAGALAEAYAAIGGKVIQAGKPYPRIYARALAQAARFAGKTLNLARVLAIGDAMHTDIKGGQSQSLATLFVTSGIHRGELHRTAASELDAAAFRQFFENTGFAPTAAITELRW
jgi:HAD superfamily hydrolase (TIGR01459 family)